MTPMRLARAYAVDVLLRLAIGQSPAPKHGVILIDEPAENRIQIRWHISPHVYVARTNRLMFERRLDGSLDLCPCPPRRPPPPRREGVVYSRRYRACQTASWYFPAAHPGKVNPRSRRPRGGERLVDTGCIYS